LKISSLFVCLLFCNSKNYEHKKFEHTVLVWRLCFKVQRLAMKKRAMHHRHQLQGARAQPVQAQGDALAQTRIAIAAVWVTF
jgi:hypothetical protein